MEKERKFLHGFIKYTPNGTIVPGSLIITPNRPHPGIWEEVVIDLCCDDFGPNTNNGQRAFVKFSTDGKIVPGSLVMGKHIPKPGIWKEVSVNLCCDITPVTTTTSTTSTTTSTTTTIAPVILPSVPIGLQIWTSENLDITTYRNGDIIPQVTDNATWASLTTGAWCWYNNDPTTGAIYGKLYNWYAVNDPRGLAPIGWHLPSDAERMILETYLGGQYPAGGAMKEAGLTHWLTPNTGATNSSGFTGLPGGFRFIDGTFDWFSGMINNYSYWWNSTEFDTISAWGYYVTFNNSYVFTYNFKKTFGFSVRLIKD
jgi:uncharacterized protein (TIGR02145 family)